MRKKVYSASVTPLMVDGELDVDGLNKIFDRNIRHGLDGVFILGTMGEWNHFSDSFRDRMIAESIRALAGRMELLVGITATSTARALENMQRASAYKFDSYVFMLPQSSGVVDPVRTILTVLDRADRTVFYYHCPANNKIELSLAQFEVILAHPNLKGIKNSSGNMWLRRELLLMKSEKHFKPMLLEGHEWVADEALMVGCDGMLCGMGALGSKFMTGIARAVESGDIAMATHLQNRFIRLFHGVYGADLSTVWVGQKYALKCLGLCASELTLAQEMTALTDKRKREIEACVEEFRDELD